jgi:hypothetical protein
VWPKAGRQVALQLASQLPATVLAFRLQGWRRCRLVSANCALRQALRAAGADIVIDSVASLVPVLEKYVAQHPVA